MVECFQTLSEDSSCRVVLLTGEGKNFTSGQSSYLPPPTPSLHIMYNIGLDLVDFAPMFSQFQSLNTDIARTTLLIRRMVQPMQNSFTAIEKVYSTPIPMMS